jgi:urease accessory protein UreF
MGENETGGAVRTLARKQGWDVVKKVQETKSLKTVKAADSEEARTVRARQRAIGRELRRFFDNVVEEPIPEDFRDLLRKIDGGETPDGEENEAS